MNHTNSGISVRLLLTITSLLMVFLFFPACSEADSLTVDILNSSQTAVVGQTIIFQGTVSNNTGIDLMATDLFFDFFGFDPNLTANQLLGMPDFSILNGTTSSVVDLFSVTLGSGTGTGILPVNFVLQDVNGNLTAPGEVTVVNAATTPEPATILLLVSALVIVVLRFCLARLLFVVT